MPKPTVGKHPPNAGREGLIQRIEIKFTDPALSSYEGKSPRKSFGFDLSPGRFVQSRKDTPKRISGNGVIQIDPVQCPAAEAPVVSPTGIAYEREIIPRHRGKR